MRTLRTGIWSRIDRPSRGIPRAFTFIEIIVVLMVLGISVAIAFPRLDSLLLTEPEPGRSGRKLTRVLRYAQELAVVTESAVLLRIDVEAGRYWVTDGQNAGGSETKGILSDLAGQFPEGVWIEEVEPAPVDSEQKVLAVRCDPDGHCDPVVVDLTAGEGRTVQVVVGECFGDIELIGEDSLR